MPEQATAHAIDEWPDTMLRTPPRKRERCRKFEAGLGQTTSEIVDELDRLDPDDWTADFGNQHQKANGLPQYNANPDDPGFVLKWTKDGEPFAIACDKYERLETNAREVYMALHETRMLEERAAQTPDTMFAAARLPPGDDQGDGEATARPPARTAPADPLDGRDPHDLLDVTPDADDDIIEDAIRRKKAKFHPDGDDPDPEEWRAVQAAEEVLLDE